MAFDPTDFILEDFVPEPGFEFTLPKGSGRDVHGFLATAK